MKGVSKFHAGKFRTARFGWRVSGEKLSSLFVKVVILSPFLLILVGPAAGWCAQPTLASSEGHTVALKSDGTVWAWGFNADGQLGDGTDTDRWTPVQVKGPGGAGFLAGVKAVTTGACHTLALKEDGTVWAWGDNELGQIGDDTDTDRWTPVQVKGPGGAGFLTGVKAVAAGGSHSLALKEDGTVWAWGFNYYGQLGDNSWYGKYTPVQVRGPGAVGFLTDMKAVAADGTRTIALKTDGTVWGWGRNDLGQLGDGATSDQCTPVQVKGPGGVGVLADVTAISAGLDRSMVLKEDGTVWGWGKNEFGQLGDDTVTDRWTPVQVKGPGGAGFLTGVTAVAAGWLHSAALRSDGTVWAWGCNGSGQLGDDTMTDRWTPVQVKGPGGAGFLADVTAVEAGFHCMLALKGDGTVWAWGDNYYGQLGDNSHKNQRFTPVQVLGPAAEGTLYLGIFVAYYLPRYTSMGGYWTGVGLKNGNLSHAASVTATVYESTGTVLDTESKSIDPRGQAAFMVGSGLNKEGWVNVTSDGPLTGLGFIALTGDDKLMYDIPFVSEPATTLQVPHVAQDATWDTIVYVCNPHDSATTMYLTFFDSAGTAVKVSHGYTLPANGSGSCPLSTLLGGDSYTSGSVRITASQGVAAFALYHNLKTGDRSYAGINAEIPQAAGPTSCSYYLPYALADAGHWTGVGLRNESGADSATVTVTGIRKNGSSFGSQTKTISSSGQTAFMMNSGEGWVKITSDRPLTGLGFVAMAHDDRLMFDIPFVSELATKLYVPHVAQDATWDTIVYVCNPHGSATTLYLTLVRSNGTVVVSQPYTLSINASGAYPLSAIVGGGAYTSGSVEITASQGVAAFALYHNLKTGDRSYAGIRAVKP
ncbi:MAG TPA: hypothetical protein PLP45_04185 [Syntrophales bacterium]|nr:hypothetical protein [Syntrophales bacterium]